MCVYLGGGGWGRGAVLRPAVLQTCVCVWGGDLHASWLAEVPLVTLRR